MAVDLHTHSAYSDGTDTTFDGEPIATRYFGADYKAIFFGFPLYYLTDADAQVLVDAVLGDLGEPKGVAEHARTAKQNLRTVLFQNSPNPFSKSTCIRANIGAVSPAGSSPSVMIYDAAGRVVTELLREATKPGIYRVKWDGRNSDGSRLPSAVYFVRMKAGDFTATKKMILLR